ncbi:adenosylcobinamide-GDP ribazoletransferase [Sphingobium aquiterrae]|uniref:adenosylcobinamide-GDP ribazoletransferase n=1 Tax=Sphingobium aquiterrae TaxID=2038656 RepID=UPI00301B1340
MRRLILAMQFMTRLPLPAMAASEEDFAACMRWFPVAGLAVGAVVSAATWAGGRVDPWAGALAGLVGWIWVTGALHLDGLGDIADAAGAAHKDRSRLSAVLADPHIGSFGATAIALQLIAKLVLLRLAIPAAPLWAIAAVPAIARIGPLVWTLWLPPLHQGLGARFGGAIRWSHVACWLAAGGIAACFAPGLAIALPLFIAWGWWIGRRIGGISGDGHGAGIELVESGLLLGLLCAA